MFFGMYTNINKRHSALFWVLFFGVLMMKKMMLASLMFASSAFAHDWTPYLQGMKNTCDTSALLQLAEKYENTKQLPKAISGSVTDFEVGIIGSFSISLKNATAFGYPINAIESIVAANGTSRVSVHFKNADFMRIAPQFYLLSAGGQKVSVGTQKIWIEKLKVLNDEKFQLLKSYNRPYDNSTFYSGFGNQYGSAAPTDVVAKAEKFMKKQGKLAKNQTWHTYRVNKTGWDREYAYLHFDKGEKSIECGKMASG